MPSFEVVHDHPAARVEGWGDIRIEGSTLTLHARHAGAGTIVLMSNQPTAIRAVNQGEATLRPGWDGTLGYSRYALDLSVTSPGLVRVEFEFDPVPSSPVPTTPDELAVFEQMLATRVSKFPNGHTAFRAWQAEYRQKLESWLMACPVSQGTKSVPKTIERYDMGPFDVERIRYMSRPGRVTEALLSMPVNGGRVPLLVALHGHEATWGAAVIDAFKPGHNDDFCEHFASRGWAVLQPATMNHNLQSPGGTLQGDWTIDAISALDHVMDDPRIDASRIAVCGLSTGAHLAMNVLSLDDRVREGVVGCVLSTWHHVKRRLRVPPHCDCGITMQLSGKIEQCDWAALMAPKRVQFQYGRKDACFTPGTAETELDLAWNTGTLPQREFDAAFAEVRRAWVVAGAPSGVSLHFHEDGHKINNAAAFAWLSARM